MSIQVRWTPVSGNDLKRQYQAKLRSGRLATVRREPGGWRATIIDAGYRDELGVFPTVLAAQRAAQADEMLRLSEEDPNRELREIALSRLADRGE